MAYSELIKDFNRVREYMRDFYVYGFKSRNDFTGKKSARTYDDVRRRIQSWLNEYFRPDSSRNAYLLIDSRLTRHNPLYKAWKTKTFTDSDIFLHFTIMDILATGQEMQLDDVNNCLKKYLDALEKDNAASLKYTNRNKSDGYNISSEEREKMFELSSDDTIRNLLNDYYKLGLLERRKVSKTYFYRRTTDNRIPDTDILDFFSEVAPCGVVGSFLLDKVDDHTDYFAFKHHYITSTMDSDVLCTILTAIREKKSVTMELINRRKDSTMEKIVVPLRVMISVQNGRQYMMGYSLHDDNIEAYRLDNIATAEIKEKTPTFDRFDEVRKELDDMQQHIWGVSLGDASGKRMEHIEFTIKYGDNEKYIPKRLEREKRNGHVEHIDEHTSRFSADVYNTNELIPWVRTFICRITDISVSNQAIEENFKADLSAMYEMYGLKGGDENAIS